MNVFAQHLSNTILLPRTIKEIDQMICTDRLKKKDNEINTSVIFARAGSLPFSSVNIKMKTTLITSLVCIHFHYFSISVFTVVSSG